jgi:hypothetical protein
MAPLLSGPVALVSPVSVTFRDQARLSDTAA